MKNITQISSVLAEIKDHRVIKAFFIALFTRSELDKIDLRWELLKMLEQGVSQREIAHKLHISLCKITRGSRELKRKNSVLKRVIRKYTKKQL
jgi:TrpR family trp operon transcriptional repressor